MEVLKRLKSWFGAVLPPPAPAGEAGFAEPRQHQLVCAGPQGLHRMAYVEWGAPDNPRVVLCVHGLTRNGRDFDFLARALAPRFRVVCPDVVGRGRSDWLADPAGYDFPQYVADMVTLIARLDVAQLAWVGTSMGGLIGMSLASLPGTPIERMVLNDIGPRITATALRRIGQYVGKAPLFPDLAAVEAYLREVSAPFGPLTDAQWRHLAEQGVRKVPGGWALAYDPALGDAFRKQPIVMDVDLWPVYDAIRCPTLALRGAESDLLTHATLMEMTRRGPCARPAEIEGVGHAPMLMASGQIALVSDFLEGRSPGGA